ncbi:liver-expressed antimicrobial peptide 2 [Lampetra fluviatilis]
MHAAVTRTLALSLVLFLLINMEGQGAPVQGGSELVHRQKRLTPLWRSVFQWKPKGFACRANSECITRLCKEKKCSVANSTGGDNTFA